MILNLFRKNPTADAVTEVYRAIVAQSRQPVFYAEWGVPDTLTGRFDMISLHVALLLRRLRRSGADATAFSQQLFDYFFKDMDRSLREMGVSDLGVPKRIQKMSEIFYGLLTNINDAMDKRDSAELEAVIRRNLFGGDEAADAGRLAAYLMAQSEALEAQSTETIRAGQMTLKDAA
jgi:cytochrome b pre-mRNA-processing protein 3